MLLDSNRAHMVMQGIPLAHSSIIRQPAPGLHRRCSQARLLAQHQRAGWRACTLHRLHAAASDSAEPELPKEGLVSRLLRPLKDFGFGRNSVWEGGVGLFVFAGIGELRLAQRMHADETWAERSRAAGFAFVLITWARGGQLGGRGKGYEVNTVKSQVLAAGPGLLLTMRCAAVHSGVPAGVRHQHRHRCQGAPLSCWPPTVCGCKVGGPESLRSCTHRQQCA